MIDRNKLTQLQRLAIAPSQLQDRQIFLTPEQYHYLSRVLRLQKSDRFIAMNGQGEWWLAQLEGEQAQILEQITVQTELPVAITLMVALPKGNGFDEVVRQATELGVSCIMPVISDRTLLKPSPQKVERWRRIATEAAEQSERQIVPEIFDPIPFSTGLSHPSLTNSQKSICLARGNHPHLLNFSFTTPQVIATGPEGGWTEAEVEKARSKEFQPVSLGRRILTAVLAPIVALSLVAAATEIGKYEV